MPPKGSKLNTPVKQESTIEHTPEYDAFMAKLAEYHEKRGYVARGEKEELQPYMYYMLLMRARQNKPGSRTQSRHAPSRPPQAIRARRGRGRI